MYNSKLLLHSIKFNSKPVLFSSPQQLHGILLIIQLKMLTGIFKLHITDQFGMCTHSPPQYAIDLIH